MSPGIITIGMDVHKESITLAVLPGDAPAPTRLERLPNDLAKLRRFCDRLAEQGERARARRLLCPPTPGAIQWHVQGQALKPDQNAEVATLGEPARLTGAGARSASRTSAFLDWGAWRLTADGPLGLDRTIVSP